MGGVYSANGEVILRRQRSDPSAAAASAAGKRNDWAPYSKSPHHTHHHGRNNDKSTRTSSASLHQHQHHQHHRIRWSIGAADVISLDPRRHHIHHRRQELIPRAKLKQRPSQLTTNISEYRQSRMFVSSSLERIPPPTAMTTSCNRVNVVGSGGDYSGRSPSHDATENNAPPRRLSSSSTSPADASSSTPIAIPTTRTSTCPVKPLVETVIENDLNEKIMDDEPTKINIDTEVNIEEIEDGEEGAEQNVEEKEISSQIKNSTTPTSTYSRYDIYRWRERPFGPSYRRKERQRREQELQENINENNNNHDNEDEEKIENEKQDRFPFVNNFNSPQTYYEEEYSYEPDKRISSMKTVLRTRSMVNLDADDGKVFVRKTLSDANLDQDKNTNFRYKHDRNTKNNNNNSTTEKHYFGVLDQQNNINNHINHNNNNNNKDNNNREKNEILQQLQQQKDMQQNGYQQYKDDMDEGEFRQCLRDLMVNNELVIQPRRNQPLDTPNNRRCFYHPVRVNRELIDEELPDPDQVKLARDRFEKVLKIKGPEAPRELQRTSSVPPGQRVTPEVRVPLPYSNTLPPNSQPPVNDKWTDNGSLSSGISSASEDVDDQLHEVSTEVLQKIRACGTTVTYYGGKVIAQSRGPPSPLTSTIMEEIKFRLEVRDRLPFEEYHSSNEH